MNIIREEWWPTPIWYFDIPQTVIDYELISNECYHQQSLDPAGRIVSNVNGWQSHNFLLDKTEVSDNIKKLMLHISDQAQTCFSEFGTKSFFKPKIYNFWININKSDSYNKPHIHPNSIFSAVYYAKASENSGGLTFHKSPNLDYIHQSFTNCDSRLTFSDIVYKAIPGRVIIFPSWISHSVMPNSDKEDRISIALNFTE